MIVRSNKNLDFPHDGTRMNVAKNEPHPSTEIDKMRTHIREVTSLVKHLSTNLEEINNKLFVMNHSSIFNLPSVVEPQESDQSNPQHNNCTYVQGKIKEIEIQDDNSKPSEIFIETMRKSIEIQGITFNTIVCGVCMRISDDHNRTKYLLENIGIYAFAGKIKHPIKEHWGQDHRIRGENYQNLKKLAIASTVSNKLGQYRLILPTNNNSHNNNDDNDNIVGEMIYTILIDVNDAIFVDSMDYEGYYSYVDVKIGHVTNRDLIQYSTF